MCPHAGRITQGTNSWHFAVHRAEQTAVHLWPQWSNRLQRLWHIVGSGFSQHFTCTVCPHASICFSTLQQQSQHHIYNWLKQHTATDKLTVTYWHRFTNFVMYWQLYCLTDQFQNVTYRITILSVVRLGVKHGQRPRVFKIRVLRKISDTKRDKIIAGWMKQHNEKFHEFYCWANIIGRSNGASDQLGMWH